ncbi:MAG: hypothetical protein D6711_02615 [Chloroflexi bacterium]|nr:MAG: hypothetical protein D6711_02615 [Chloroflexota bacterium]
MLNQTTLQHMRQQVQRALPDLAELYDPEHSPDAAGGADTVWVLAGTVPCRLDPLLYRQDWSQHADQPTAALHFLLTVPHDAPLRPHQLVLVNARAYRILTLVDQHSWHVAKRAHLTRHD